MVGSNEITQHTTAFLQLQKHKTALCTFTVSKGLRRPDKTSYRHILAIMLFVITHKQGLSNLV